ncbi:hypothetical protein [Leptothrix ochracea]|uniref:hypothetical protein n=1 Tax=Leptothrix ochracea TaxID=735331 RepID=UPI0034E2B2A0
MTQDEYIYKLKQCWQKILSTEPTKTTIILADLAVQEHPKSSELWRIRGNLLELANFDTGHPLKESLRCYRLAVKLDPFFIEAYEDLAWFLDAVLGNRRKAKRFFDKAWRLRHAKKKAATCIVK